MKIMIIVCILAYLSIPLFSQDIDSKIVILNKEETYTYSFNKKDGVILKADLQPPINQ